jgi:hypothetical protein
MTKPKPIIPALIAVILALAAASAAFVAHQGARSPSAGPTVNLAAAARGCAVVHVVLHGTAAPTITCQSRREPVLAAHHGAGANAVLDTFEGCAGLLSPNLWVEVNGGYVYCFYGNGYLGLNPTISDVISLTADSASWVRLYYYGAGTYFNMVGNGNDTEWFKDYRGYSTGAVGITQVCDSCGYHS